MISSQLFSVLSALPRDGASVFYQDLPGCSGELLDYALKQGLITATQGLQPDSLLRLTQEGIAAAEEFRRTREAHTLLQKTARDAGRAKWLSVAASLLAAASLVVTLVRPAAPVPASPVQTAQEANQEAVPVSPAQVQAAPAEDFDALWESFQARQKERLETPFDHSQIQSVLVESQEDANAITDRELDSLMQHHPRPATISAQKAREDVDLLMRLFRSCYAAYYYFGEAAFEDARQTILSQLPEAGDMDTGRFEALVSGAFAFLRDAHAGVVPQGQSLESRPYENSIRQRYYYSGLPFSREGDSLRILVNGEAWEFDSFSDHRVRMEPFLGEDGTVCYSPMLLCSETEVTDSAVVLKKGQEEKTLPLQFTPGRSYLNDYSSDPDYRMMSQNGVFYISQRAFMSPDTQVLEQFSADGAIARDAELIVFDIRSNGGGDDSYAARWLENFRGTGPQLNFLFASRSSKITQRMGNPNPLGSFEVYHSTGSLIPNDIPIVVLVDDRCGSSGESMLNNLRNMDNVIVVGSNSAGFQLCGNVVGLTLPNSGMTVQFGTSLSFQYSPESVDFRGYAPDIWCDPATALDAVWNMLIKYGKITPDQVPILAADLPQSGASVLGGSSSVVLRFQDMDILPGEGFGTPDIGPHFIDVLADGRKISDYQLENGNPDACSCEILEDGTLKLTRTGPGESPLVFTIGDLTVTFNWYGGEEAPVPVQNCDMTLGYYEHTVLPGQGFGSPEPDATHPLTVILNGEPITDFQVENENPAACTLEIDEEGIIHLTRIGPGGSILTIRTGDSWATFRWYGGE